MEMADSELIPRLLLAALLGGLLGIERELKQKAAGPRTNILIALGSALFTLLSIELAPPGADPTRIVAQVITGVGFLGAGAIMRTDSGVQGLTTAATVWVNAAVGVAAGGGQYHLAFSATAVTLVVLFFVARSRTPSPGGSRRQEAEAGPARPASLTPDLPRRFRRRPRGSAGRPASTHAAVMIAATPPMESETRLSRIGFDLSEKLREIDVVVDLAPLDGRLVGVENRLDEREARRRGCRT